MKTIAVEVPEKTTKEQIEQFLRYAPGSPTQLVPLRVVGMPLAFGDAANC